MKLINAIQSSLLLSAAALSMTATASAQVEIIGAYWGESFGGSTAGASFNAGASTMYMNLDLGNIGRQYSGNASASVNGNASLFGWNIEAFHFGANATVNAMTWAPGSSTAGTRADARVLGFTLYESDPLETALSVTIPLPPYSIIDASKTFTVGPVPVTVSGALSLGAELGFTADANVYTTAVSATPSIRGWIQGMAGVGLGTATVGAGVEATMRVADTTLGYSLVADVDDQVVTGIFNVVTVPLAIEIEVYVQLFFRFSLTVYEWAMPFNFQFKPLQ